MKNESAKSGFCLGVFLEEAIPARATKKSRTDAHRPDHLYTYFKNKQEISVIPSSKSPRHSNGSSSPSSPILPPTAGGQDIPHWPFRRLQVRPGAQALLRHPRVPLGYAPQPFQPRAIGPQTSHQAPRTIARILGDGIKAGSIRKVNVKGSMRPFYAIIESAIVKLVVMKRESIPETLEAWMPWPSPCGRERVI
jgi:hypothetical protein